jgi:hypothetical protein
MHRVARPPAGPACRRGARAPVHVRGDHAAGDRGRASRCCWCDPKKRPGQHGQGADELFGGYRRYLETATLADDLARDIAGLEAQATRDQSVAALFGVYLSMPYLDMRVVRAALAIPAGEKVRDGKRKVPLRRVAERHLPAEIAWHEKKAMQYGSGIWKVLQRLARKNGYKTSLQDYIDQISVDQISGGG